MISRGLGAFILGLIFNFFVALYVFFIILDEISIVYLCISLFFISFFEIIIFQNILKAIYTFIRYLRLKKIEKKGIETNGFVIDYTFEYISNRISYYSIKFYYINEQKKRVFIKTLGKFKYEEAEYLSLLNKVKIKYNMKDAVIVEPYNSEMYKNLLDNKLLETNKIEKNGLETIGTMLDFSISYKLNNVFYYSIKFFYFNEDNKKIIVKSFNKYKYEEVDYLSLLNSFKIRYDENDAVITELFNRDKYNNLLNTKISKTNNRFDNEKNSDKNLVKEVYYECKQCGNPQTYYGKCMNCGAKITKKDKRLD